MGKEGSMGCPFLCMSEVFHVLGVTEIRGGFERLTATGLEMADRRIGGEVTDLDDDDYTQRSGLATVPGCKV
jgi:hypothetical protein